MSDLKEAREKINEIDKKMAELFMLRMKAASEVAEYKRERGLTVFDKAREDEVIKQNSALIEDSEIREYYVNFLRYNMDLSKSYQDRILSGMKVAYSGTEGAFAHIAAKKLFPSARKLAYGDFFSVYRAVESGECDACVLPIENSYNGEVGQVTDLMFSGSLYINEIFELAVSHDLIATKEADINSIKLVLSHPQALAQCADFIRERGFLEREYTNTALAAKFVAESNDPTIAAIASEDAAEILGLQVLARNINSSKSNTTRFAVFSRAKSHRASKEMGVHTIIVFTVRNEAGALAKAIEIIGKHGFNMRSLRSRPMKELLWQYYFYVEAEGNVNTEDGAAMMRELNEYCDRLKAVGTYVKQ